MMYPQALEFQMNLGIFSDVSSKRKRKY